MQTLAIHQVVDSIAPGSAVSNAVLSVQKILRETGYYSDIYARSWQRGVPPQRHRVCHTERTLWLYHFSVGSPLTQWVERRARRDRVLLWYHNLTPSTYFRATDPALAERLTAGREELRRLAEVCAGAIADSEFNAAELRELGYENIQIVPPVFLDARYRLPGSPAILERYRDGEPHWLFVGRLVPNKGQGEVINAFHAYRQLAPGSRLLLVGGEGASLTYRRWLENQIAYLGLREHVELFGQVDQATLNACYQAATCFVSMSEHEGFGVPLVESFYFDVPVIAYAAAAVPGTLGEAGILLHERDPYITAEVAHLLHTDTTLREAVLARQRARLADYQYENVARRLFSALRQLAPDEG